MARLAAAWYLAMSMLRSFPGRSAAFLAALAVGLAGCSLVESLDGLTGGTAGDGAGTTGDGSDVTPGDGAAEATGFPDATAGESGADSGTARDSPGSDGGAAGEGGSEDSSVPDARTPPDDSGKVDAPPALGFCASQSPAPMFCDDFDEGAANPAWDQVTGLGGSVAINDLESVSAPDSMVSTVDANQNEDDVDLAGYESLTAEQGVAGTVSLAFEIRIDAGDTSAAADAVLGAIQLYDGSALYDLELELMYASATTYAVSLTENAPYLEHATGATVALATWTRVTMSVVLPAGAGGATSATLTVGASTYSTTVHVTSGGDPIATPIPEALVGVTFATPAAGGWSVRYDNVTFDVK
jgi:hypothetical protein